MVTLEQASKLMLERGGDFMFLANSKELNEFVTEIQHIGIDILKDVNDDQYKAITLLIEALIVSELFGDDQEMTAMLLMSKPESFAYIISLVMKMTLGLAITQEWR